MVNQPQIRPRQAIPARARTLHQLRKRRHTGDMPVLDLVFDLRRHKKVRGFAHSLGRTGLGTGTGAGTAMTDGC